MRRTAPIFLDLLKPLRASAPVANGERESGHLCVSLTHSLTHLYLIFTVLFRYTVMFLFSTSSFPSAVLCVVWCGSRYAAGSVYELQPADG